MSALRRNLSFLRVILPSLLLAGLFGSGRLGAEVQKDSPEMEYIAPDQIEFQSHVVADVYSGFNEFVRSADPTPPAPPQPPKKFATLTWNGFVTESRPEPDWTGSSKTVFSGTASYSGATYVNELTSVSYLNADPSDPGDGSFGEYTVIGYPGGGCGELHSVINVKKTAAGSPGGIFGYPGTPDSGSPAPTQLTRTFFGAMNWHWNDLEAPCNLMDFDFSSTTFPVRGPVTETLSTEVKKPGSTDETRDGWTLRDSNALIQASMSWGYAGFESWSAGSQTDS